MRKIVVVMLTLILGLSLTGCFGSKEKEFEGTGLKVTLDSSFSKIDVISFQLALQSKDHLFMENREAKSSLPGISNLDEYYNVLLSNTNGSGQNEEKDEDGNIKFIYGYYTASNDGQNFGYMLVVFEGEDHYYVVNFAGFEKDLEKNKTKFLKWAKTIVVE
ncbi:hypothetical protein [Haploplasma axanthum]|uniref:Lipoprotein n=1 Tax=Haploplasma axanthum TaxID=29552 RepID=A0A449BCK2_HAPAX|nr:hypothetical protein [Haploplasma axanthum]VEU80166.1 Uncharacterised protein [Haploplasma axanthum]